MRYIISERQYRVITEDRFSQVSNIVDILNNIIDNFDMIDCEDENYLYDNKFARIYCEQLSGKSLEQLEEFKFKMEQEMSELINQEFSGKIR